MPRFRFYAHALLFTGKNGRGILGFFDWLCLIFVVIVRIGMEKRCFRNNIDILFIATLSWLYLHSFDRRMPGYCSHKNGYEVFEAQ